MLELRNLKFLSIINNISIEMDDIDKSILKHKLKIIK